MTAETRLYARQLTKLQSAGNSSPKHNSHNFRNAHDAQRDIEVLLEIEKNQHSYSGSAFGDKKSLLLQINSSCNDKNHDEVHTTVSSYNHRHANMYNESLLKMEPPPNICPSLIHSSPVNITKKLEENEDPYKKKKDGKIAKVLQSNIRKAKLYKQNSLRNTISIQDRDNFKKNLSSASLNSSVSFNSIMSIDANHSESLDHILPEHFPNTLNVKRNSSASIINLMAENNKLAVKAKPADTKVLEKLQHSFNNSENASINLIKVKQQESDIKESDYAELERNEISKNLTKLEFFNESSQYLRKHSDQNMKKILPPLPSNPHKSDYKSKNRLTEKGDDDIDVLKNDSTGYQHSRAMKKKFTSSNTGIENKYITKQRTNEYNNQKNLSNSISSPQAQPLRERINESGTILLILFLSKSSSFACSN